MYTEIEEEINDINCLSVPEKTGREYRLSGHDDDVEEVRVDSLLFDSIALPFSSLTSLSRHVYDVCVLPYYSFRGTFTSATFCR